MEIMDHGTQLAFLWRLVNATQSGSVQWAANDEHNFWTRIGRFGYVIMSQDQDDVAPFVFVIYRFQRGSDSQEDVPERLAEWKTAQYSVINDPLQALYLEVKGRVLGINTVAGDMFEDLASVDGGPKEPESMPVPPEVPF